MHDAVLRQSVEALQSGSRKGFLELPDAFGQTPLLLAVELGLSDIAHLLLRMGANPNVSDDLGFTPLMRAADAGDVDLVCALLNHGADLEYRDCDGLTAAHHAYASGHPDVCNRLAR